MTRPRPTVWLAFGVLGGAAFTGVAASAAGASAGGPEAARAFQGGLVGTAAAATAGGAVWLAWAAGRPRRGGARDASGR